MSTILDGGNAQGIPIQAPQLSSTQAILYIAAEQLQDLTGKRWTTVNLIYYLNLAMEAICTAKPEAYMVTQLLELQAGYVQPLPAGTINIVDVTYNMGITGALKAGKAILEIPKIEMDHLVPDWPTTTAANEVIYAVVDDRDPKNFFVYPPQPTPAPKQNVELLLSMIPTGLTSDSDTFPLDDSYKEACIDYIIGRSLIEETTVPNAIQKGNMFMQRFYQDLGLKGQVEKTYDMRNTMTEQVQK